MGGALPYECIDARKFLDKLDMARHHPRLTPIEHDLEQAQARARTSPLGYDTYLSILVSHTATHINNTPSHTYRPPL